MLPWKIESITSLLSFSGKSINLLSRRKNNLFYSPVFLISGYVHGLLAEPCLPLCMLPTWHSSFFPSPFLKSSGESCCWERLACPHVYEMNFSAAYNSRDVAVSWGWSQPWVQPGWGENSFSVKSRPFFFCFFPIILAARPLKINQRNLSSWHRGLIMLGQPCLWLDSEGQAPPGDSRHSANGFQWSLEGPGEAQCAVMWVLVLPSCV